LAQINIPPPMTHELSVEELDILIAGIDRMNEETKKAGR
jgi:hypothetical protein